MSLKALPILPVPEETARVAQAVFPHGNVFMQVRDNWERSTPMRCLLICFQPMASPLLPHGVRHW